MASFVWPSSDFEIYRISLFSCFLSYVSALHAISLVFNCALISKGLILRGIRLPRGLMSSKVTHDGGPF